MSVVSIALALRSAGASTSGPGADHGQPATGKAAPCGLGAAPPGLPAPSVSEVSEVSDFLSLSINFHFLFFSPINKRQPRARGRG
jgi:hypothetical protein